MRLRYPTVTVNSTLNLSNYSDKFYEQLFKILSVPNPVYEALLKFSPWPPGDNCPPTLDFAEFTDTGLSIPRGAYQFLPVNFQSKIKNAFYTKDKRVSVPVEFPRLRLTLNDQQQEALNALKRALKQGSRPFGSFLFLASTAAGKTILQAAAAALLGQRTLVLCPTDQILRAWYADLHKAYGLRSNQIGLIKGTKFKIQSPFTLATPQTLGRRQHRWAELNKQFGSIVIDETQILTAPQLYAFVKQSPAQNLIGATATQEARSGVNHHLRALMGAPLINLNTYGQDTTTSMRITGVHLIQTTFNYVAQQDNIDWYELGLALTSDEERNQLIIQNVYREWLDGRVIMIVTKLREHVELLVQMLTECGVSNVNRITGETNQQDFYTKSLMRGVASRKLTCIVATQQAIKIGANIPALDSLHVAIPPANQRDFEQLIGRIRRKTEGKSKATVTYYVDVKVPYMQHLYRKVVVPTFQKLEVPGF